MAAVVRLLVLLVLAGVSALPAQSARAHVTELAVVRLTEIGPGQYTIGWDLRPNTQVTETLQPIFPDHCTRDGAKLDCGTEGLVGSIGFEGLGAGQAAALFKIGSADGTMRVITLTPAQPTADVSPAFDAGSWAGMLEIAISYTIIGFEHILQGIDHLMFVLGLIWIATGRWALFKTITAFTVAHSVTLALVTFGWVGVPEAFVNAMIALSIVFIGVEVVYAQRGRVTWTARRPWAVAFAFGLLHGMGFASALVALGLPEGARPLALLAFNVGVELGQIAFVLGVLAMAWAYRVMTVEWPRWARLVPAYAIGGLAALWFAQRTEILLGV